VDIEFERLSGRVSADVEQYEVVETRLPQKTRRMEAVGSMDLDSATPQDASSNVAGRLVTVNEKNFLGSKIRWPKHGGLPELEGAFGVTNLRGL